MCDPTSMMISQGFSAATSAIDTFYQQDAKQASYEASAKIADVNARLAELTAQSVLRAGQQTEQAVRLKTAATLGSQKAAYAANGVDLGSDSVARVSASTKILGEIDASTVKANAARGAWGYRTQGVNYQNAALMDRVSADGVDAMGAGFSSLLTGAGNVANNRYKYQASGLVPKDDWFSRNIYGSPGAMF